MPLQGRPPLLSLERNQLRRNNMKDSAYSDFYISNKLDSQKSSECNFRKAQVVLDFIVHKNAIQLPLFDEKKLAREKRIIDLLGY